MSLKGRPKLRTIVEQPLVTAALKRAKEEYPRIEEMFDGIKWKLARNPVHQATKVLNGEVLLGYVLRTISWKAGRVPSLTVVYRVTEDEIFVEALTIREE